MATIAEIFYTMDSKDRDKVYASVSNVLSGDSTAKKEKKKYTTRNFNEQQITIIGYLLDRAEEEHNT